MVCLNSVFEPLMVEKMNPAERRLDAHFDVIVIGAGINGAGVARDAAMRGLQVLLLDKGDVAAGTSSASTRLIHGGLRYLEHAEFGLVREALWEREVLLHIAPHLVKPLPILLPIFRHSRRGRFQIRSGMLAYDGLSRAKTLPRHRLLSPAETLEHASGLMTNDLVGGALYFDGQVEYAERLVLENVLSAGEYGATVLTYHRVRTVRFEQGRFAVEVLNTLSKQTLNVTGSLVVNASGPWVDEVIEAATSKKIQLIGGTKGSHIVVGPFRGAPRTAVYVEARSDRRPFFIIPWNGHYLIGTTDLRYTRSPDDVHIEANEVAYLLRETNQLFPKANLDESSILFTFSGVRPLSFSAGRNEESITRRHFLRESPDVSGLISIVGGKLTTYRKVAEETIDLIAKRLRRSLPRCTTGQVVLPGAVDFAAFADEFRRQANVSSETTDRLLQIYGARADRVTRLAESDARLALVIDSESGGIAAEIVFALREEFAQTLSDVLFRRTLWAFNSRGGFDVAEKTAAVCADYLGWSVERVRQELEEFESEMRIKHQPPGA